jgi:hypothetical protein
MARWEPKPRGKTNPNIIKSGLANSEPSSMLYVIGEDRINYADRSFLYAIIDAPDIGDPTFRVISYFISRAKK